MINLLTMSYFSALTISLTSQRRHSRSLENWKICHHVASLDLYPDEDGLFSIEFGLLVRLRFFVVVGPSYRMAIPEVVTFTAVKQTACDVLSTADDLGDGIEVVQSERQLHTLSAMEAETWRLRQIMMRRFRAGALRQRSVQ